MAKKKDKDELEQVEGKAIKNAKSLQDKQRENEEKLQAELKASVEGYFSNMFQYTLVKGILLLDVEQGVTLEHFEIKNIEDIKNMFENEVENDKNVIHKSQKENIGLIDDLFNVRDLIGVVDGDLRMLEGEDIDGKMTELGAVLPPEALNTVPGVVYEDSFLIINLPPEAGLPELIFGFGIRISALNPEAPEHMYYLIPNDFMNHPMEVMLDLNTGDLIL